MTKEELVKELWDIIDDRSLTSAEKIADISSVLMSINKK